jgi:hypothetical protein
MNEKETIHFIELSIEHNAIPQEGIKWVKGLLDLYNKEKEKNRELHSLIDEHVYNGCDYELCNKKWKDKIKEIIEKCKNEKENANRIHYNYWNRFEQILESVLNENKEGN